MVDIKDDPFEEYIRQTDVAKSELGASWQIAIGLQAVDGMSTSNYLKQTAIKSIDGDITIQEAEGLLQSYYKENQNNSTVSRTEEADKVAARITSILTENAFTFSPSQYIAIHKRLFDGIYKHAGKLRDYNLSKKEWVLDGNSVTYGSAYDLKETLEYDFNLEKSFNYEGLSNEEIIEHIATFAANLWQIHIFGEGNTRTTAVFLIKYLRSLGFEVTNEAFAKNSWYFRNALVRANYNDVQNDIVETKDFLILFLRNLLLGETNELHNRSLHISGLFTKKQYIGDEKQYIGDKKQYIGNSVELKKHLEQSGVTTPTVKNIVACFEKLGGVFGRLDVMDITGLSSNAATVLIKRMYNLGLIEPVVGKGKGKYRFLQWR